jgi:hypothetical protein
MTAGQNYFRMADHPSRTLTVASRNEFLISTRRDEWHRELSDYGRGGQNKSAIKDHPVEARVLR